MGKRNSESSVIPDRSRVALSSQCSISRIRFLSLAQLNSLFGRPNFGQHVVKPGEEQVRNVLDFGPVQFHASASSPAFVSFISQSHFVADVVQVNTWSEMNR